jgi:hypothetical protein
VVLFLHNTSRVEDEKYPTLLRDKGFGGFPSLCFMDAEGNVLAKPARNVAGFVDTLARSKALVALRSKGDKATAAERKDLFLTELRLDLIAADQIQARADTLSLGADEKALVASKLVDVEVGQVLQKARDAGMAATNEQLAAFAKAGKTPSEAMRPQFWIGVLNHASGQKDGALAQQAFDALEKHFADDKNPALERAKANWKKLLDASK